MWCIALVSRVGFKHYLYIIYFLCCTILFDDNFFESKSVVSTYKLHQAKNCFRNYFINKHCFIIVVPSQVYHTQWDASITKLLTFYYPTTRY